MQNSIIHQEPTQDNLTEPASIYLCGIDRQLSQADAAEDGPKILSDFEASIKKTIKKIREQHYPLRAAYNRVEIEVSCFIQLFESSTHSYLITAADGTIQKANSAAARLFVAPYRDALVNIPLIALVSKSNRRDFLKLLSHLKQQKQTQGYGLGLRRWDRSLLYTVASVYAIENKLGGQPELLWLLHAKGAIEPTSLENKLAALSRGCLI